MSRHDIDRTLAEWFEADALAPVPGHTVDRTLDGVRRRKPRPAWLAGPGSHWGWNDAGSAGGVHLLPRLGVSWSMLLILVVLVGVLLGGAILVGARLIEPPSLPSANLGRLAYAMEGDIYVAEGDGQDPLRIADGLPGGKSGCGSAGYWSEGPMWSPDGRFLAFRSPRSQVQCDLPEADTIPTVLISDPAGHVVAEFPGVGWRVAWSADSNRVATWLDRYPMTKIGVFGLDGVRQTVLSVPPSVSERMNGDFDPVWSSDGTSLLVPTSKEAWEIPVDGGPARPLPAEDPRNHWLSSLSPDGSRIAYIAAGKLVVAAVDGSRPRELVADATEWWTNYPVWSPTGDRIAIAGGGDNGTELRVIDVATGSVSTPMSAGGGDGLSVIAFSPDGDRILILYSENVGDGEAESLWSVDADGTHLQKLVIVTTQWGLGNGDWQTVPTDRAPINR